MAGPEMATRPEGEGERRGSEGAFAPQQGSSSPGPLAEREPRAPSDVGALLEPYRRELLAHCYRMTGSLQDAEDLVQETMIRAFRRFDTFKGSSSLRTWLYAIATNVCLDALRSRRSRTLPTAGYPPEEPGAPVAPPIESALWIEPFPDARLTDVEANPEARSLRRESLSLAFLVLLQLLPARQRAILILSDVLDWRASEIAELLEMSVLAVTSALHRARATLAKNRKEEGEAGRRVDRGDPGARAILDRFMQAFEEDDVAGIVALLKEDAIVTMPPTPSWYRGREQVREILATKPFGSGIPRRWRLYPTIANGEAAFGLYRLEASAGAYLPYGILMIPLESSADGIGIAEITAFHESRLVALFGLPPELPPPQSERAAHD